jgi:UDP-N-acetylglucosamine--N-acetylmuramyl-(pentapeptide) pyrophosphoryl-undecaprenol N-acetylglucosamine transferase
MKIVLTGGGSGGHFYPIIAVAEALRDVAKVERLLELDLYFFSDHPYSKRVLFDLDIKFKRIYAGKRRLYFSPKNFFDLFKTAVGLFKAILSMYQIFPDVVFGKGGYASFPALFAAKIFGIPVVIHESDSVPGRVNLWAAKFARRIAVSYPEAINWLPRQKVALTGNPIRKALRESDSQNAHELLDLDKNLPTILVLGGSQGAKLINDNLIDILPTLITKYQIIHQTGINNFKIVADTAKLVMADSNFKDRYRPFEYLNDLYLKAAASAADLIISRAGSAIFEIALWGKPSIIIPISESNGDHQRKNAFNYAAAGCAVVIEEVNLKPNLFLSQINLLMEDKERARKMSEAAKNFARADAAEKIAKEIIAIALEHEE